MAIEIKVLAQDKATWADGTLVIIEKDKQFLGSESYLADATELKPLFNQFRNNPKTEMNGYADNGKKVRSALFLSTKQVKYYTVADKLRILGSRAMNFTRKTKSEQVLLPLENASEAEIEALLQGMSTASYSFEKYKTPAEERKNPRVSIVVDKSQVKAIQALVKRVGIISTSVSLARDLVNEIPAELYPEKMATIANEAATEAGLKVTVYDEKRLQKERFNGILSVGKGSIHPPRLTVINYTPTAKSAIHLCLVGKAVTFDTGGHSIKQAKGMWEMKGDMAGGAAVAGAMQAIGKLQPGITVTGIIPSALNAIGPNAILPGDIIRSRSGKTVHVDNTDAEGRLLLMDALHLAQELGATHIVDIATLTGSIVATLGHAMSGLFANNDELANDIIQSGSQVGEGFWRMPLIEEYKECLEHSVADIDNVGNRGNSGAVMAALFLQEFVSDSVKWAHLDIAGCGLYTKTHKCCTPGGSGFAVQTLVQLAFNLAQSQK